MTPSSLSTFASKKTDIILSVPSVSVEDQRIHVAQLITHLLVAVVDGASLRMRVAVALHPNFNFSQDYIPCLYKELSFTPPNASNSEQSTHT